MQGSDQARLTIILKCNIHHGAKHTVLHSLCTSTIQSQQRQLRRLHRHCDGATSRTRLKQNSCQDRGWLRVCTAKRRPAVTAVHMYAYARC
jgi:hypothetical protein